jgi:hypothetical protein
MNLLVKNHAASCGASSKEKANMGAAAPKPPLAIHPHSKLRGILAFSLFPIKHPATGKRGSMRGVGFAYAPHMPFLPTLL